MQQLKKLRLIMVVCLILSTFSSLYSQVIDSKQYNYVGNWYRWQGGSFITNLNLPKVTATTGRDTGAIRYALADSSIYVWTGYQWRQLGVGGGGSGSTDSSVFATRYYTQQTFVPYTGANASVNLGAFGLTTDRLVFNQSPTLAGGVGIVRWNDTDGTLEFGMKGSNVTQQIGQELPVLMRNSTGSTITNGQVVYMSGSTGTNTIVALAKADAAATSKATIGIATEDIPNGQTGFITTFGKVRDINTTGLTEGALVYLSSTVAGGLTSTPPTGDTYPVVVGICERTHAVNGVIFVHVDREFSRKYEVDTALNNRLQNITGLITEGAGISLTGSGTGASPYVIAANAEGVTYGTYAQRVALTGMTPGQRFYQTNERVGEWKYDGSEWIHYPPTSLMRQSSQWFPGALTTSTSGAGAGAGYGTQGASFKMSGGFAYVATGTTTTGSAVTYATRTTTPQSVMPGDSADNGYKVVLVGKVALFNAPTAAEDFRFNFGTRNAFSTTLNDSTGYGYTFSIANYRNSTYIECYTSSREPQLITTTTSVPITNAVFPQVSGYPNDIGTASEGFITFVLVYNTRHCDYFINGTLVASHALTGTRVNDNGANDWILTMHKRTGTTSRLAAVESLYSYYIKDNF